ncbi:phage tail protein [Achromobacter dolens]|uniref:phage tail protein n=1 Tax=Achromobacter dolens TaxID=1287738 RepID=UPI003B9DA101
MRRIATPTRQLNKFGPGRDGFTNGDPIAGVPSTDLEADWFDALQEEAATIAEYGGVALDPNDNTQVLQGILRIIAEKLTSRPLICSILDLPTTDVGPIIVTECSEVWTWANTAFFTGYRSLLCGRPLDGHTAAPLASEVDAVGGLLPKVGAYAGLWGYAQEQSLVRTEAVWQANRGAHWFSDYSATQFRVPDLRDMFRRFTGTDLDTANARVLASRQLDAFKSHDHPELGARYDTSTTAGITTILHKGVETLGLINTGPTGGAETRPRNVAYHPRLHV